MWIGGVIQYVVWFYYDVLGIVYCFFQCYFLFFCFQQFEGIWVKVFFYLQFIWQLLMVEMWCVGGFCDVYFEIDGIDYYLQYGGDDLIVVWVVGYQSGFVIFYYNGW